jgi:hypothetical protein
MDATDTVPALPSGNAQDGVTADTKDGVTAATLAGAGVTHEQLSAAVNAAMSKAAPADEIRATLAAFENRIGELEKTVVGWAPVVETALAAASPAIAAEEPAASPILARLPAIEATVTRILDALTAHFGAGKIPNMPVAIAAPPPPA